MIWSVLVGCVDPLVASPEEAPVEAEPSEPSDPATCVWSTQSSIGPDTCAVWRVEHDILVDSATIAAGTVVEVAPGVVITLLSSADLAGTKAAPITFRSDGTGSWAGFALTYAPEYDTYWNYGSIDPPENATEFTFSHVTISDTGAGDHAAVTLSGAYQACGYYSCTGIRTELHARDLTIRDAAAGGIDGEGWIDAIQPIGFADVAGTLITTELDNLDQDLVVDLGGNARPAIAVTLERLSEELPTGYDWASQSVPLLLSDPIDLTFLGVYSSNGYGTRQAWLTIEPNTVLFAATAGIQLTASGLEATGVTFGPLEPGAPWQGIVTLGDVRTYYDGELFWSELTLDGCTIEGTRSPAIDWRRAAAPPELTQTLVREVITEGDGVCVVACVGDLLAPELGNTFDCVRPVDCPGG